MKRLFIFLLASSLFAMKEDTKIDIRESDQTAEVKCGCKLCKGTKITIATNVISILVATGATMLINYSQCPK